MNWDDDLRWSITHAARQHGLSADATFSMLSAERHGWFPSYFGLSGVEMFLPGARARRILISSDGQVCAVERPMDRTREGTGDGTDEKR